MQEAIASEIESVDFDLGFLPSMDKANVAVRNKSFDFETAVTRHDHQKYLRWRDNTANRMNRELLCHAVDWSGQLLKLGLLLSLDQILSKSVRLLLGLVSSSEPRRTS